MTTGNGGRIYIALDSRLNWGIHITKIEQKIRQIREMMSIRRLSYVPTQKMRKHTKQVRTSVDQVAGQNKRRRESHAGKRQKSIRK
jgi:hypothetical protein